LLGCAANSGGQTGTGTRGVMKKNSGGRCDLVEVAGWGPKEKGGSVDLLALEEAFTCRAVVLADE